MIDEKKLKIALVEKGETQDSLAQYLGINPATLSRKIHGISDFTRSEILKTCDYLDLESPIDIFFNRELA